MFLVSSTLIKTPSLAPDSSGFSRPLTQIPGDNRKAGVDSITYDAFRPTPVHSVVLLQVTDDCLNTRPQPLHPPKPRLLLIRPLGHAFRGIDTCRTFGICSATLSSG